MSMLMIIVMVMVEVMTMVVYIILDFCIALTPLHPELLCKNTAPQVLNVKKYTGLPVKAPTNQTICFSLS